MFKGFEVKKQLPEKLEALEADKRFPFTVTLPRDMAASIYLQFETPSQFIEWCINEQCKRDGVVCTKDGFISKKQTKVDV